MIEKVRAGFVAVEVNITDRGFPRGVAGLKPWEEAFGKDRRYRFGFATSVVLGPQGNAAFGTSGCGHLEEWESSINYHPEKYLTFLDESLARYRRALAIARDAGLSAEARAGKLHEVAADNRRAIQEAARCRKSGR